VPITKQQLGMMAPRGKAVPKEVQGTVVDMCFFTMLEGCVRGKLFEGCSTIGGIDLFCSLMYLHFAKNSAIRERLPRAIETIQKLYLEKSGVTELVCFHDECYGAFTHVAPAFGIEVPFKPVHLFEFLCQRLDRLKDRIQPLGLEVAYQRPCSARLIPETHKYVDEIFERIGVERVEREYQGENTLCCGGVMRAQQRHDLADDLVERNLTDMKKSGAFACVFNCPYCLFTLGEAVAERGMTPILMSELCQMALGEGRLMTGR
jgi:Fe-S oxidoreductase